MTRPRSSCRPPGRVLLVTAAAAMVAVAVAVTGCQPVQSGAAVVIGNERVSVGEIQDRVTRVNEQRERTGQPAQQASSALTQEQVRRMVVSRVIGRVAEQVGVGVVQAEIDAHRRLLERQAGGPDAFARQAAGADIVPGDLNDFLRDILLAEKIGEALVPDARTPAQQEQRADRGTELVGKVAQEMEIRVNPRYGRWNPAEFTIEPAFGDFVKPEFVKPEHEAVVPR